MNKYLLLSDIHLNSHSIIKKDIDIYNYFIKHLKKGYVIILVGDIFDIIVSELIKFKREYKAIKACYPKTSKLIENNKNIIYIKGNHDAVLERLNIHPNIRENFDIVFKNYKIHIEHGHMHDLPNGKCHCVGDSVSRIWGCCKQNVLNEDFADKIATIDDIVKSHKKLKKKARKSNDNLTIFGHTHKKYLKIDYFNKVYINTGEFNKDCDWIDETRLHIHFKDNVLNSYVVKQLERNIINNQSQNSNKVTINITN